ncbi:MAG: anti-sigma factor antagonist [Planctomycetota bacterium]|nr:MAG: anti-sigma factor antagonist [Planctomycetota bacterium]
MSELAIERRERPEGVTVLSLRGVLDGRSTRELEVAIRDLLDEGRLKIVVDCAGLAHLSSDGMGVFLSHLIKLRKQGGDIKFCSMRQEVRTVLSVLGLGKLLCVYDTEDEAVADFGPPLESSDDAPQEKLRVDVHEEDGVSVLALYGFVDRHTIGKLDEVLAGLLAEGKPRIVVDCAELTYISSNGMGVFISYVSKARNAGGDIRLCCMRDIARTVVTMLGLHRLFEVFPTRAEAVASYA